MSLIMDKTYKELPKNHKEQVENYSNDQFAILRPKIANPGEAVFSNYFFIIPFSNVPNLKIDNKLHSIKANRIFPINPYQQLESVVNLEEESYKNLDYISMFVDSSLVDEVSSVACNKSGLIFNNESCLISNELMKLIQCFIEERKNKQLGCDFLLQNLSTQIIITMIRQLKNNVTDSSTSKCYTSRENIKKSIEFLRESYNDNFSLNDIARYANLSPYHFIRVFKSETGKTPYEYLLDIKIEKAQQLLRLKEHTVTEVGMLCGFSNPSHFAVVFKKKTGISPSDYRKMIY